MLKTKPGEEYELTQFSRLYQTLSGIAHRKIKIIPSQQRYNITISNESKFIWFRVAKVGTRTIFNEFKNNNISLDAVHPMSVYYPPSRYRKYFKFAFVRNPWGRLCSCWRNKVVDNNYFKFNEEKLEFMQNFENFVDYVGGLNIESCDHHLRAQNKLIDINNVNYIGRFETFSEDLVEVFHNLGIDLSNISKENASNTIKPYQQYYNSNLINKVSNIYKKDIQLFNYKY